MLRGADVVILGEVHDNPAHHANQARAVAAIAPRALVFEMLEPGHARMATPELRGDADGLARAFAWKERGWPDFAMYNPILAAAPDAAIFGGALPRETVRRAMSVGAAAVLGAEAGRFGLGLPLDPGEQAAREAEQQEAHCNALPADMLAGMVEAQRLRDAAIARAVIAAYEETGGPVAVIAGNGHARNDWGVPAMLPGHGGIDVLAVGQFETGAPEAPPYDFWLVTDPAPRPDPCAAFR